MMFTTQARRAGNKFVPRKGTTQGAVVISSEFGRGPSNAPRSDWECSLFQTFCLDILQAFSIPDQTPLAGLRAL
jgi:hypothetical protein